MNRFAVFALAVCAVLAGCDALSLEERPETFLAEEQFYRNAADAQAALFAAYEPFQDNAYYQLRHVTNLMSMADYVNGRGSYSSAAAYDGCDQTCKDRLWNAWNSMYSGINNANLVIARVPEIEMDAALQEQIVAEAHFIRALNYVNLVRYWGGVPLRTEPLEGLEALAAPRASADDVYDLIISDLQLAGARLPATNDNGRATRWAATALLADVYLGRENWAEAAAKAEEVIDSGAFALVEVQAPEDFEQIFGPDVDLSSEEIFDIPFISQDPFGMQLPSALNDPGPGYGARPYRALFADGDAFIFDWDEADLRHDFNLYVGADTLYLTEIEPQRFKKFGDPSATDRNGHGNDFPVLRYPDALLIFAEAAAMASGAPTEAAYDALNRVRRRAYGVPLDAPNADVDLPADLGLDAFRDAVIQERAYEFLAEGKRYWDLKRTGMLEEAITAVGEDYDPKYQLWPLPQEELDANEALSLEDQNPGW